MLAALDKTQKSHLTRKDASEQKSLGQYFTGEAVAVFMASMIESIPASSVRILDAGAGAGILAVAASLRCLELGAEAVEVVLYEIDPEILQCLRKNLEDLQETFSSKGRELRFEIREEDFVLDRPDREGERFDLAVINPPYFKYHSKDSPYAGGTADLFRGNPNIYASFMAVVGASLSPGGRMISIVPRSFTNGLYFKGFRQYLTAALSLDRVHIFRARNEVFRELAVLQENVICCHSKGLQQKSIEISTSTGYRDLEACESHRYPASRIIDGRNDHRIIRIPESQEDARILEEVEKWESDFSSNGYFISTGPVVEHRTREFITQADDTERSVPLLRMHNVKALATRWTGEERKDARFRLLDSHEKHTQENQPLVVLKRFSSKDEKKRLVAAVHDPRKIEGDRIALENHLNYVGRKGEALSKAEAYGLALLLNSTVFDRYFRCVSGNTQVNATEIRMLHLPPCQTIRAIGEKGMRARNLDQQKIDALVQPHLTF